MPQVRERLCRLLQRGLPGLGYAAGGITGDAADATGGR